MQVRHLSAYDVAPETIEAFRAAIGDNLLPAQELAVREGLLCGEQEGRGQSLLIAAPTSAGKTFIGEMAAIHAARTGMRVFYLVPLKAMAEEVYRTFASRYARLDLKVVISTRDHREFDAAIESGSFHVAVLVYEKLQSLLVSRPELLGKVGLIVLDELQMLADQGRGPKLELLLTKIRKAQRGAPDSGPGKGGPQLLCLSAPMAGLDELGAWLGAHVVIDERRPVELRAGVIHRGTFTYRSTLSAAPGAPIADEEVRNEELYEDPGERDSRDLRRQLQRTVSALAERGEQTLVFLPDKAACLAAAQDLCATLGGVSTPAAAALDEIAATDEGQAREALLQTLQRGVAFHNSDLTRAQRDIVERAFRDGEIRVLCATSTLAMGVNLPAKNVVLAERWKWRYSRRYNKWVRDELNKIEYDSMSGRAGRLGLCDPVTNFGRSLLIAPSRFDAEVWMRTLVGAPVQEVEPTLLGKPLGDVVLDLVASELCHDEAEVIDFLLSTFTGHVRWSRQPGGQAFAQSIGLTVEELVRNDLLARDESGGLVITAVGRVCARKGLMVRSAVLMSRWSDAAAPAEVRFTPLEVLLVCALTPDGGEAHVPLSLPEHRFGDYWTRILLKAQELGAADRRVFRWLRDQRGRLTYEQTKSVKKALLLLDWVDSHNSAEIERDHSVWSGAVSHAAADFAWLVDALGEICDARGWPSERTAELTGLGERLRYGVSAELLGLARATTQVLSRTHLQRVAAAGVETEEGLLNADPQTLERAVGHRGILQKIFQIQAARAAQKRREVPVVAAADRPPIVAAPPPVLHLPLPVTHPEVDQAAVEIGEPGDGARLVPSSRNVIPEGADLPLDQVSVTGRPLPGAVPPPAPAMATPMAKPMVKIDPQIVAAATALPVQAAALPELQPVLVSTVARRQPAEAPLSPGPRRQQPEMVLTSETGPRRCYVRVGESRLAVSPGSFALLTRLALGSVADEDTGGHRWISRQQLGRSPSGVRKGISRLRHELRQVNSEARSWVENDGQGNYRLSLSAPPVVLDKEALRRHPLATIRNALRAA